MRQKSLKCQEIGFLPRQQSAEEDCKERFLLQKGAKFFQYTGSISDLVCMRLCLSLLLWVYSLFFLWWGSFAIFPTSQLPLAGSFWQSTQPPIKAAPESLLVINSWPWKIKVNHILIICHVRTGQAWRFLRLSLYSVDMLVREAHLLKAFFLLYVGAEQRGKHVISLHGFALLSCWYIFNAAFDMHCLSTAPDVHHVFCWLLLNIVG